MIAVSPSQVFQLQPVWYLCILRFLVTVKNFLSAEEGRQHVCHGLLEKQNGNSPNEWELSVKGGSHDLEQILKRKAFASDLLTSSQRTQTY
jgi:hypothetical protein